MERPTPHKVEPIEGAEQVMTAAESMQLSEPPTLFRIEVDIDGDIYRTEGMEKTYAINQVLQHAGNVENVVTVPLEDGSTLIIPPMSMRSAIFFVREIL